MVSVLALSAADRGFECMASTKEMKKKNHVSMVTMVTPRYLHATNMIQMKSSTDSLSE
jgi:hypothetical protein